MKNAKSRYKSGRAIHIEWFLHFILFILLGLMSSGCATQLAKPTAEYREKATYLYRFGQFVEWPPLATPKRSEGRTTLSDSKTPVVIGILGGNPFGDDLEKITAGGKINGRPVIIRRMNPLSNLKQCQILFINRSVTSRLPLIFNSLSNAPVLTVGETDGFLKAGGTINFIVENGKVRFEIAPANAQKAGLKMSAQLLTMAARLKPAVAPKRVGDER